VAIPRHAPAQLHPRRGNRLVSLLQRSESRTVRLCPCSHSPLRPAKLTLPFSPPGSSAHNRYFQLKEMDKNSKDSYVESHKGAYASFGAVALALGLVPVVGTFFSFSNAVGAALYAADLEKQERAGKSGPLAPGKEGTPVKAVEVAMGRKDEL
jgi:hypothetical protein